MASKSRRKSTSVSEKLFAEPYRFSFFQATRLLQGIVRQWQKKGVTNPVGHDVTPQEESVRFSSYTSLQFASAEIPRIVKHQRIVKTEHQDIAEMQISFMGLSGQSGVLPDYFTEVQLQRLREKDASLRDFLDLFNHRSASFFYRAREKYHLPLNYERAKLQNHEKTDAITHAFKSILGLNGSELEKKLPLNAENLIFYAGYFASPRRSAAALEASLSEYLGTDIKVNQFKGEWMPLHEDDRFQLPIFPMKGQNNCLGVDTVIGSEVFTVEGKFQLVLGPLSKQQFDDLLPDTEKLTKLNHFTKLFVGANYHYDLKYDLLPDAVSAWHLGDQQSENTRLGWNSWLLPKNKEDAVRQIVVDIPQH